MRQVYADTVYWIALANPLDQWHPWRFKQAEPYAGR